MKPDTEAPASEAPAPGHPRRRHPLLKALKWIAVTAGAVVALIFVAVAIAVAYLTPERLTPLVNRHADRFLLADVETSRVELSLWSSFPRLEIAVDSLTIDSRALEALSPEVAAKLPDGYRRLLTLERFAGAIDIPALLIGSIHIHNVELLNPAVNLVAVNDSTANYLIALPSDDDDTPRDDGPLTLPSITLDRFAIAGHAPVRYFSLADSIDATVTLTSSLTRDSISATPVYTLAFSGDAGGGRLPSLVIPTLPFSIDGRIGWSSDKPLCVSLADMDVRVDSIDLRLDADIDMTDTLTIGSGRMELASLPVARVISLIPDTLRRPLAGLVTDLTLKASARLTAPYRPAVDSIPSAALALGARGSLRYDRLHLTQIDADITADIDGADPDNSVAEIRRLLVVGRAIGFELSAKAAHPFTDLTAEGTFKGGISFDALPPALARRFGYTLSGLLTSDTRFGLRLSDLTPERFHRLRLDGDIHLKRFKAAALDSSARVMADGAILSFGTASKLALPAGAVDSLLTVSLRVDTLSAGFDADCMKINVSRLRAGVATRNVASSADTSVINPIGARIGAHTLTFISAADSMAARLSDVAASASLTRYHGEKRTPLLNLSLTSDRAGYADPCNRAALRGVAFSSTMHLRGRDSLTVRSRARLDSLRALHPGLTDDSLRTLLRARREARRAADSAAIASGQRLDLGVDRSLAALMRRLDLRGALSVERGWASSRYFPLRNRLRGMAMHFTTDSVAIDSAALSIGRSALTLSGHIANITSAISSGRRPLEIEFHVDADSLDVNEIAEGIFAGADFANNKAALGSTLQTGAATLEHTDDLTSASADSLPDSVAISALIIPSNVNAEIAVHADRVRYSDLDLHRFSGEIAIHDGAAALNRLSGFTDIGSVDISALYEAPDFNNLRFAAGIKIDRLLLARFLGLIPQLDTIMPLLSDVDGIVNADMALSSELDSTLDLRLNTLRAVMRISGDSLRLLDSETFRTLSKWLMFKNKKRNIIDHLDVELAVGDGRLDLYPFILDIDRYRLGVRGNNDFGLNLDYHIAVLKSPLPFRFGVNIKGTADKMKIRLGKARFDENIAASHRQIADTARVNLLSEIRRVFAYGVKSSKSSAHVKLGKRPAAEADNDISADTISRADSLLFIREGVIEAPDSAAAGLTPSAGTFRE